MGRPHQSTIMTDDFLALTLDVWSIPPGRARRVGHPAPFPVELPEQLIRLYTFEDDLVLDPFTGSGSALVAAARLDRRYVGYDLDPAYVELARRRMDEELAAELPPSPAAREGKASGRLAEQALTDAGFTIAQRDQRIRKTGVVVDFVATDGGGAPWWFVVAGPFTGSRHGMARTDVVWKSLGRASALRTARGDVPLVFLTTQLPPRQSEGDMALRAAGPELFYEAVELLSADGLDRLSRYAEGHATDGPHPGFWTGHDLPRRRSPPGR